LTSAVHGRDFKLTHHRNDLSPRAIEEHPHEVALFPLETVRRDFSRFDGDRRTSRP
jgi:hypothetical protein